MKITGSGGGREKTEIFKICCHFARQDWTKREELPDKQHGRVSNAKNVPFDEKGT